MIRITIKAPFLGDRPQKIFRSSADKTISALCKQDISFFVEPNKSFPVYNSGYPEMPEGTVIEVQSEDRLSENEKFSLMGDIKSIIAQSYRSAGEWGKLTFIFSVVTIVT